MLQFASLGSDVALEEILGPLWAGGQVVLADRDELLDPGRRASRSPGSILEVVRVDGTHQTVVTTHLPVLVAERLATLGRCEP